MGGSGIGYILRLPWKHWLGSQTSENYSGVAESLARCLTHLAVKLMPVCPQNIAPGVSRLSDPRKSKTEVTMPFIAYTCKWHTAISVKSFWSHSSSLLSVGRDCTVVWVPIGKNHWGQCGGWLPHIILSESYIAKSCIFGWILKSKEVAFNSLTWKRETGAKRKLVYWNGWYHGAISRKINIL